MRKRRESIGEFLKATRIGLGLERAADYAGMSKDTIGKWLDRGQAEYESIDWDAEDAPELSELGALASFYLDYKKAKADFEARNVSKIATMAEAGSWQASAWLLERRSAADWGLQRGDPGTPSVKVEVVGAIPKEDE